jgi:hypothetical protein
MSKALNELIRQYDRDIRMSRFTSLRRKGKIYSKHLTLVDQIADEIMDLHNDVRSDVILINELEHSNESRKSSDSVRRYYEQNRIVSSQTYSKIMSYYQKYKDGRYYSVYKVDRELHNFLIKLGEYLEKLDSRVRSGNWKGYSTAQIPYKADTSEESAIGSSDTEKAELRERLANMSVKLVKIGAGLTVIAHAAYPILGPLAIKSPAMVPLLKIVLALDAITNIMVPLGAIIHPDRTSLLRKFIHTTKVKLGLYKSIGYSLYINYIYK